MRPRVLLLALALALVSAAAQQASAEPLQRMLVAPGCYDLAPGKDAEVSAFCLDEGRRAPPRAALLTQAPPRLGDALVRRGAAVVPLETAMDEGWLLIEGSGRFSEVRLRNVSGEPLSVCFRGATVVMAGDGAVGSLDRAFDALKRAVGDGAADGPSARAETQQAVWAVVKQTEAANDEPKTAEPLPARPRREGALPGSGPTRCSASDPTSTVACIER